MSSFTPAARAYAWKQLFQRVGIDIGEQTGESGPFFCIGAKRVYYAYKLTQAPARPMDSSDDAFYLIISPCHADAMDKLLVDPTPALIRLEKADFQPHTDEPFPLKTLPVLFWGEPPASNFASINGRTLTIHADILAAAFFLLSRYEEAHSPARDKHGRHPYHASLARRAGLIDLPLVDYYALLLRLWLGELTSEEITTAPRFSLSISHDIDYFYRSHPLLQGLASLAHDLRQGHLDWFRQDLRSLFRPPQEDQYFRNLEQLIALSRHNGTRDTFFLLTQRPFLSRDGYSLRSARVRRALQLLTRNGFELGLHASYGSFMRPHAYREEKSRLELALGRPVRHVRQHFLRVRTPHSWRRMAAADLAVDESYGYAEHEGFRCGTCFPFEVFDIEADRELPLVEKPLIVMDTTLKSYRRLSLDQAEERIFELARHCLAVGGCFSLLWHNTSLGREWDAWGERLPAILSSLIAMEKAEDQKEVPTT